MCEKICAFTKNTFLKKKKILLLSYSGVVRVDRGCNKVMNYTFLQKRTFSDKQGLFCSTSFIKIQLILWSIHPFLFQWVDFFSFACFEDYFIHLKTFNTILKIVKMESFPRTFTAHTVQMYKLYVWMWVIKSLLLDIEIVLNWCMLSLVRQTMQLLSLAEWRWL